RQPSKLRVAGSNPVSRSKKIKGAWLGPSPLFLCCRSLGHKPTRLGPKRSPQWDKSPNECIFCISTAHSDKVLQPSGGCVLPMPFFLLVKHLVKKVLIYFFARLSIAIAARWPAPRTIAVMQKLNGIILTTDQILSLAEAIKSHPSCKLLIFGLGFDSLFWAKVNLEGITLFLEDDPVWMVKITRKSKMLDACGVKYGTKRKDWQKYLANPELNRMELPQAVMEHQWDVILVDAPAGWGEDTPGRMKSIFQAARLAKLGGDVFVHDCDREVETTFCDQFLGARNLALEIPSPQGHLRHYKFNHPAPGTS
ncbi:MAG: hypothetical protein KQI62_10600, partial [Deltaproteobacteria bacterium]|nr:hypothetical protein [Deltaproteobacteria bacterium]